MQNKLFRIHDDAQREIKRLLRSKEPVSDAEYQAAVAKKIEAVQEEAQVQKEYYERFLKILPARKIVLIFDAEARFSQEMMRTNPGKQEYRLN